MKDGRAGLRIFGMIAAVALALTAGRNAEAAQRPDRIARLMRRIPDAPDALAERLGEWWRWRLMSSPGPGERHALHASGHPRGLTVCFRSGVFTFDGRRWKPHPGDRRDARDSLDFEAHPEWTAHLLPDGVVTVDAEGTRRVVQSGPATERCRLFRSIEGDVILQRDGQSWLVECDGSVCLDESEWPLTDDDAAPPLPFAVVKSSVVEAASPFTDRDRVAFFVRSCDPERSDRARHAVRLPHLRGSDITSLAFIGTHFAAITDDGRLWVCNLTSERWGRFTMPAPESDAIHALARHGNDLLIGSESGVYRLDGDRIVPHSSHTAGLAPRQVTAVAVDAHGATWIGSATGFRGAYRLEGDRWTHHANPGDLGEANVHRIRAGRDGSLWFALEAVSGDVGLARLDRSGEWTRYGATSGFPSSVVFDVLDAADGYVYAATGAGLVRREPDGRWRAIPLAPIAHDALPRTLGEYCPGGGAPSEVWVGYGRCAPGIQVVQNGRAQSRRGDLAVAAFARTGDTLWFTSNRGLFKYRDGILTNLAAERGAPARRFGAIAVAPDGTRMWAATRTRGLIRHVPDKDCAPVRLGAQHSFDERTNESVFQWWTESKWHLTPISRMRFRIRIDGGEWSAPTHDLVRKVRDLPPGAATFEVQAIQMNGNALPAQSFSYVVPTSRGTIVRRAAAAAGLLGLALVAFVVQTRRRRRKRTLAREARVADDLRESEHLRHLGLLAGGVAHDLNNVLVGVLGNAAVIGSQSHDQETTALAADIEAAGERAADLCRQLLAYAGKGTRSIVAIDVSAAVSEMLTLVRASLSGKVRLRTDFDQELPAVAGDPTQIQQTVLNLVMNASDALGPDGGEIRLTTSVVDVSEDGFADARLGANAPAGRYVRLEVRDSGTGMDEETLDRLFDPFFSTKGPGRGLGLLAVPKILTSHRGVLRIVSTPGAGTTFSVYLPVSGDARSPWRRTPPRVGNLGGGAVLLIEDRPLVRTAANTLLEHLGFDVITAEDGTTGIALAREHAPRIRAVLLDLNMPVVGGMTVFKTLRRDAPDLPIVLSSGYEGVDAVDELDANSAFLHKPYTIDGLAAALARLLAPRAS